MDDFENRPSSSGDDEIKNFLAQDPYSHFPLVIDKYWVQLVKYATTLVSAANAEDVVQTALINACVSLQGYSRERILYLSLRSWLFTIVTHECYHLLRKKTLKTATIDPEEDEAPLVLLLASAREQPEKALELAEIYDAILAAIERLPSLYRSVIYLRYLEDMKGVDIAAKLGKDLNTIKAQIKRGTALLQVIVLKELEGRGEEQLCERIKKWLAVSPKESRRRKSDDRT